MNLTQSKIDTQNLSIRAQYLRLELLDLDFKTIDSIEGECVGGSLTKNANDDLRRSGSVTIAIPIDRSATTFLDTINQYSVEVGGKIWLDKYIKVFYGIENYQKNPTQIEWFSFGICLIDQPSRNFNSTQYEISFSLIDLMAKLTGIRQGQLTGITTLIEKGKYDTTENPPIYVKTKLDDVLRATISELGGFSKFSIYPIPEQNRFLPYDIKIGIGSTVYDIIKQLMDLIPEWQIHFDDEGILNINPIPSGKNDIVYPLNPNHIINDTMSYDFQNVKNQIIIYGRLNNLSYYAENTIATPSSVEYLQEGANGVLQLKYTTLNTNTFTIDGTIFGFKSLADYNQFPLNKIRIYNGSTILIDTDIGTLVDFEKAQDYIDTDILMPNQIYSVRIMEATLTTDKKINLTDEIVFEFFGKQQVSDTAVNDVIENPYYINSNIKGENYYGGLCKGTSGTYNITLNNQEPMTTLNNDTIITFMANALNTANQVVNVYSKEGNLLVGDLPIVSNKFGYPSKIDAIDLSPLEPYNNYTEHVSTSLVSTGEFYDNNEIFRLTMTPDSYALDNISTWSNSINEFFGKGVRGISITTLPLKKYCAAINWREVSNHNVTVFGNAQNGALYWNIGGNIPLTDNWKSYYNYMDGTTNVLAKTDLSFFSFVCDKLTEGESIIIDFCFPRYYENIDSLIIRPTLDEKKLDFDYTIWQLKYSEPDNYFIFLGRSATALILVLSGGEYDNIYTDQLATERAVWELYKHSNLNNSIKLDIIPNFTLDVNVKIPYYPNNSLPLGVEMRVPFYTKTITPPNEYQQFEVKTYRDDIKQDFYVIDNTPKYYLIKNITFPLGIDSTPQNLDAIEIFDDNFIG